MKTMKNLKPRLYLCGGINGLSDEQCNDWRNGSKAALEDLYEILDPMRRDYRGVEAANVDEIVQGDLLDIDVSTALLVNATRPSWGTAMEVFYACYQGKYIVAVCPFSCPSPWLIKHSSLIVKSFREGFKALVSKAHGR